MTWTDNRDFSWAGGFAPVRVTLDAAEEEPEYHQRMTAYLAQPGSLLRRPGVLAVGARSLPEK